MIKALTTLDPDRPAWNTVAPINPRADLAGWQADGQGYVMTHQEMSLGCSVLLGTAFILFSLPFLLSLAVVVVGSGEVPLTVNGAPSDLPLWVNTLLSGGLALLFGIAPLLLLLLGVLMVWSSLANRRFGKAWLRLSRAPLIPGESVQVQFGLPMRRGVLGQEGVVVGRLVCLEVEKTRTARNGIRHKHRELLSVPLPAQPVYAQDEAFRGRWNVTLPGDAPANWYSERQWVVWVCQVQSGLGGRVKGQNNFTLEVTGPQASGPVQRAER